MSVNSLLSSNDVVLHCGEIYNKHGLIVSNSSSGVFPIEYVSTSPYIATAMNTKYVTNYSSGIMDFTLPSTATNADEIVISNISSSNGIQISPGGTNIFVMANGVTVQGNVINNFSNVSNLTISFIYLVTNTANNYWIIKDQTVPFYAPVEQVYSGIHALSQLSDINISGQTNDQVLTWEINKWVNKNQSENQIFLNSGYSGNLDNGYMGQGGFSTNETHATYSFARASNIVGFYVQINVAPGSNQWIFTVLKDGIATSMQAIITGSNTFANVTGSVLYDPHDNFAFKVEKVGGPPATSIAYATILYR